MRKTLEGITRTHGKPKRKAKALRLEHLDKMLAWLYEQPDTPKKSRDIALLLMVFFGAFRRSELIAITNVNFELIKKQGSWKSDATVWEYIDEGQMLSENASHPLMQKVAKLLVKEQTKP